MWSTYVIILLQFQSQILQIFLLLSLKSRIACSCCGQFFSRRRRPYPHGMCKPHWGNHDFSPLANGIYLRVIINKTPFPNGNCPITHPITEMEVAHTVGPCTFSFCCRRATTTTSELLWKAISLVGQKILKRLFILNVAALKGSGLVARRGSNAAVAGGGGTRRGEARRDATRWCKPSTLLLLVRYARQQRLKDQLTNKKKEKPTWAELVRAL